MKTIQLESKWWITFLNEKKFFFLIFKFQLYSITCYVQYLHEFLVSYWLVFQANFSRHLEKPVFLYPLGPKGSGYEALCCTWLLKPRCFDHCNNGLVNFTVPKQWENLPHTTPEIYLMIYSVPFISEGWIHWQSYLLQKSKESKTLTLPARCF